MPTYVYEREDGSTFELVQKITEDSLTVCPDTGQKVKRVISAPMVVFKGSGFYQTDYKSSGASSASSGGSSDDSSSSGDSSSGNSSGDASCNGKGPAGGCGACSTDD